MSRHELRMLPREADRVSSGSGVEAGEGCLLAELGETIIRAYSQN